MQNTNIPPLKLHSLIKQHGFWKGSLQSTQKKSQKAMSTKTQEICHFGLKRPLLAHLSHSHEIKNTAREDCFIENTFNTRV